jgi:antitoxin CptB
VVCIDPAPVYQGLPDPEPTLAELRWRSRRGTRELDLILLSFLSAGYENLTPQDRRAYARLLDTPDPDLMNWLLGRATPDDRELDRLVRAIRTESCFTEPDRPASATTGAPASSDLGKRHS